MCEPHTASKPHSLLLPFRSQVMPRAVSAVRELLSVPDGARHDSKMLLRGPMAEKLQADRRGDVEQFAAFVHLPHVQASLAKYMEALKARAK